MASVTVAVRERSLTATRLPALEVLIAATVAGVLALRLPLHAVVLGLVAFGIVHNFFELRYVLGRFHTLLQGPFLRLLLVGVTAIAVRRLFWSGAEGALAEIVLGYAILAGALVWAAWRRPVVAGAGLAVLAAATVVSVAQPDLHFVVITHLHNLVPLVFLWEWSRRLAPGPRQRFRAVQVLWIVALPMVVLAGVTDGWLAELPQRFAGLDVAATTAAYTPPILRDGAAWGVRFLTVFAFLQVMHYFVWCAFLPRHAPDVTAAFDARVPIGERYGSPMLFAAAVVVAGALAVVFWHDYATGRSLYSALSTYHAYLEWPVILALVLGLRTESRPPAHNHHPIGTRP